MSDSDFVEARGEETNGIYGKILVGPTRYQMIYVKICFTATTNKESSFLAYTNSSGPVGPEGHGYKYYLATNSFCGPIELRDATGKLVPLLIPGVDSPEAYPAHFDIWIVSRILTTGKNGIYRGPFLPMPLTAPNLTVSSFYLEDYFKLEKPGEYRLTVWPKIYKWVSPSSHICRRIDIPPVTLTINWQGKPQR